MGIRYRKSINLGGGFRVNISKSGVGYSWGVKGARLTQTAKGTTRTTLTLPGTGLSYVEETKNKGKSNRVNQNNNSVGQSTEILNVKVINSQEYSDFLNQIKKVRRYNFFSNILMLMFIYFYIPVLFFVGIIGVSLKIYVRKVMSIKMDYEFEDDSLEDVNKTKTVYELLMQNNMLWQVVSQNKGNRKTNGGASCIVDRINLKLLNKAPYYIKPNVSIFGAKLRSQKVYFLPDKLLILSGRKIVAMSYDDLEIQFSKVRFTDMGKVPKDAKILNWTWLYVNKNGSPDKRYKNNRKVPICEYGTIIIKSEDKLYLEFSCSNSDTITELQKYI